MAEESKNNKWNRENKEAHNESCRKSMIEYRKRKKDDPEYIAKEKARKKAWYQANKEKVIKRVQENRQLEINQKLSNLADQLKDEI